MEACSHDTVLPAVLELQTAERSMRFLGPGGLLGAASTFGGRWRVTDPDGAPLLSLAPAGAPGTDDRAVVPQGEAAVGSIMRDRRRGDAWLVVGSAGELLVRATLHGPYEVLLGDETARVSGRLWATATGITADYGHAPAGLHCLALALPLYFATTAALRIGSLADATPSLPLWP